MFNVMTHSISNRFDNNLCLMTMDMSSDCVYHHLKSPHTQYMPSRSKYPVFDLPSSMQASTSSPSSLPSSLETSPEHLQPRREQVPQVHGVALSISPSPRGYSLMSGFGFQVQYSIKVVIDMKFGPGRS